MSGLSAATVAEVLATFPELGSKGPRSAGALTVGTVLAADTLTISDYQDEAVILTLIAGTDFVIGGTPAATALAISAALVASGLFTAGTGGAVVYLDTVATGAASAYYVESSAATMVWGGAQLTGGDALADFAVTNAALNTPVGKWGARRCQATTLFAAHLIYTLASGSTGGAAAAGPVSMRKIDKIQTNYAVTAPTDLQFGSSAYGLQYLAMAQRTFCLGVVGRRTVDRMPAC